MVVEQLTRSGRQLRIAVVTETYPPEINGVAMSTGRFVEGLVSLGHSVQLIRPRQGREDAPAPDGNLHAMLVRGVPIPRYHHLKMGLPARKALLAQWEAQRPDVIQIVTEGPLGWSALSAARALRLPVVSEYHTNFEAYSSYYGLGWLKRSVTAYLRRFHNRGDITLVPTRTMKQLLLRAGYRNVEVVARGVDRTLFAPTKRSASLRESWGVRGDDLVVTHVGRLAPEKNLDLLMEAFAVIRIERPEARLVLVGDGPARQALEAQKPKHVLFAGMRSGDDLAHHYASADMFLFPSTTETFGNVTAEALASGLPVVAFDYAAAAELVRHGENGMLASLDEPRSFIHGAVVAAERTALARLRAAAAPSIQHLDWEITVERLLDKLDAAIRCHRSRIHAQGRIALASD